MALLSRAAEHLYWLGRHLERIESTARAVQEHTNLLVDLPVEVESDWSSLVVMIGGQDLFEAQGRRGTEPDVVGFLLYAADNPGSLASTVAAARENLRVTRQLVPTATWECLNQLHLALTAESGTASRSHSLGVCETALATCQQLAGIMALAMLRDHGYGLYQLGRYLERADMTTRILDSRVGSILTVADAPVEPADRSPFEDVRWLGMLRSSGSLELYHRCTTTPVEASSVLRFLLSDTRSPRSVAWCLAEAARITALLPPRKLPAVACANAAAVVGRGVPLPLSREGFHLHIDAIQLALEAIHEAVSDAWFVAGQSVLEGAGSV